MGGTGTHQDPRKALNRHTNGREITTREGGSLGRVGIEAKHGEKVFARLVFQ